jgi:membrane protease YdiL (CAAX protease family)
MTRPSPLLVFLGVAFGGSILLSLVIGFSGGHKSSLIGLSPFSMFVPALGVLAARITSGASLDIEWNRLPWGWLPVALLLLPLAIHAVALPGVFLLEGKLPWVPSLIPGWGHLAINALAGLILVSFLAFFEGIGWRAFMLPRLAERLGVRRAAVASAVIWALWHVPYALSGILHVENVTPLALALVQPAGTFGAGLFLAFLWFKTESILLVSLAHGALNNWGQYAFKFMKTSGEHDLALLVLVAVAVLAVGAGALARMRQPLPVSVQ